MFSSTPTMKPPTTAPPGLSMPPISAAAKAYSRTPAIMFGSRKTMGATIIPAVAPIAAASPQPSASIQPTRMPTSRLESGFCAAARIASPERREAEEQVHQQQHHQRHADRAQFVRRTRCAAERRLRSGKGWGRT